MLSNYLNYTRLISSTWRKKNWVRLPIALSLKKQQSEMIEESPLKKLFGTDL